MTAKVKSSTTPSRTGSQTEHAGKSTEEKPSLDSSSPMLRISRRKFEGPIREGHLWIKLGNIRKTWKILWFTMEDTRLNCFSNPQTRKAIKSIEFLPGITTIEESRGKPLQFVLYVSKKTKYKLEAESKEIKLGWMSDIRSSLELLAAKTSTRPLEPSSPTVGDNSTSSDQQHLCQSSSTSKEVRQSDSDDHNNDSDDDVPSSSNGEKAIPSIDLVSLNDQLEMLSTSLKKSESNGDELDKLDLLTAKYASQIGNAVDAILKEKF